MKTIEVNLTQQEEKWQRKYFLNGKNEQFRPKELTTARKMLELWKRQFTMKKFTVDHDNPLLFISSQWQDKLGFNLYYCIYRCLVTAFFLITLVLSIVDLVHLDQSASQRAKWLVYLTNWGYSLCTIQSLLGAILMLGYLRKDASNLESDNTGDGKNKTCSFYKVYWIANITAIDIAIGITIIYWSLVYEAETMDLDAMNIIVHIINSILMLFDLFIIAHPVRILHFYWPVLFGICYIVFSIIYYLAGGTSKTNTAFIYPILNWSKPGMTIMVCVVITIFIIVLHCLVYGGYLLRKLIYFKTKKGSGEEKGISESPRETSTESEAYNNPVFAV